MQGQLRHVKQRVQNILPCRIFLLMGAMFDPRIPRLAGVGVCLGKLSFTLRSPAHQLTTNTNQLYRLTLVINEAEFLTTALY